MWHGIDLCDPKRNEASERTSGYWMILWAPITSVCMKRKSCINNTILSKKNRMLILSIYLFCQVWQSLPGHSLKKSMFTTDTLYKKSAKRQQKVTQYFPQENHREWTPSILIIYLKHHADNYPRIRKMFQPRANILNFLKMWYRISIGYNKTKICRQQPQHLGQVA